MDKHVFILQYIYLEIFLKIGTVVIKFKYIIQNEFSWALFKNRDNETFFKSDFKTCLQNSKQWTATDHLSELATPVRFWKLSPAQ